MDAPRPGCCQAAADFARELGIPASHEGSSLFVTDLNEPDLFLFLGLANGLHYAVDAVARKPKDCVNAPIGQRFDKDFSRSWHSPPPVRYKLDTVLRHPQR